MASRRTNILRNVRPSLSSRILFHLPPKWLPRSINPFQYPFRALIEQTFVIHGRHSTVRLFYCKFPVSYLRNIAKHGEKYKQKVSQPQGVHLQRTKPYYLVDPVSRGAFFRVLARLISYLSSGESHVPFLWNREDNPINSVFSQFRYMISDVVGSVEDWRWGQGVLGWRLCTVGRTYVSQRRQRQRESEYCGRGRKRVGICA